MVANSLVKLKCKACGFEWEQRRMPRRCANCRAYLSIVGVEILARTQGKIEPKKLKEAKEPIIGPEKEGNEVKPEVKSITESKPPILPNTPAQKPKEFELEPSHKPASKEIHKEQETYDCGNCGTKVTSDMKVCPKCGVELKWEDISE